MRACWVLVVMACGGRPGPTPARAAAPDVVVRDLEGRAVPLRGLRGQVVLLDFWTTTCAPCVRALPVLVALNAAYRDRAFQLISITPEESSVALRARVVADRMTWIVATDALGPIHAAFRVDRYPMYVLIDEAGAIVCSRCSLDEVKGTLGRLRPRVTPAQ